MNLTEYEIRSVLFGPHGRVEEWNLTLLSYLCKLIILRRPSLRTTPMVLLIKTATVLIELLGRHECRVKMTSLHYFSTPLILYSA
jgi:hypothetical protein